MKKVWILEGFISKEAMENELKSLYEMKTKAKLPEQIDACDELIRFCIDRIDKNPEGRWLGYQGKTNYKEFCYCAHETLRNMKKERMKWRVVEAFIKDSASTWAGYETIRENVGVMKYLWATL